MEMEYAGYASAQAEEREKLLSKQRKRGKKEKNSVKGSLKWLMEKTRKSIMDESAFHAPEPGFNPLES